MLQSTGEVCTGQSTIDTQAADSQDELIETIVGRTRNIKGLQKRLRRIRRLFFGNSGDETYHANRRWTLSQIRNLRHLNRVRRERAAAPTAPTHTEVRELQHVRAPFF